MGRVVDMVTQTTLGYVPVSQTGIVNVQLGAWTRAIVFESAPAPTAAPLAPVASTVPAPSTIGTGAGQPTAMSQNTNSAHAMQVGVMTTLITVLLMFIL